ncbi:MAG TPA: hypothetical protein VE984_03420 [Gaiellaceae bacterium]|nr:hypothetical protein [Gaiellaceae bacterium]
MRHTSIWAVAAVVLAVGLSSFPSQGRGATQGIRTQASLSVAVVPGFTAPIYPGYSGVGKFPVGNPQLSAYHFRAVAASKLTASSLAPYDTVILYGIRWADISASGQAALNAFAATHKVMIWDADGTGSQNYSTFIHPFSTLASNASGRPQGSAVTYPAGNDPNGNDFLASPNAGSPYYLDPSQLVSDPSIINDMNAMKTGTPNWLPGLAASNKNIPQGGWPLAWSYGEIGNRTGLTIYSGLDADAIDNSQLKPNDEITELALELKAPFSTNPQSCSPTCAWPPKTVGPPPPPPKPVNCRLAKRVPTHWVHRSIWIWLNCSPQAGVTASIKLTSSGPVLASATEQNGLIHLRLQTRLLPTNRVSRPAVIYGNTQQTKSLFLRLKVDNTPPRLLSLRTRITNAGDLVTFRVSEKCQMRIAGGGRRYSHWIWVARHKLVKATLLPDVRHARLILRDRARNTVIRKLSW